MSEKKTQTIVIDDKEYTEDQLTDQQKVMINHMWQTWIARFGLHSSTSINCK